MKNNDIFKNPVNIALIVAAVVLAVIGLLMIVGQLKQPETKDYTLAKDTYLKQVDKTQNELAPAGDDYFQAFIKQQNSTKSVKEAQDGTKKQFDAYLAKESAAKAAVTKLADNPAVNDKQVKQATEQFVDITNQKIDYFGTLVRSYADYRAIFGGTDNQVCSGIFVGETKTLTERKESLAKAAASCKEGLDVLKESKNPTYASYAKQFELNLKQLQADAATIANNEKTYQELLTKSAELTAKAEKLSGPDASNEQLEALTKELKAVTAKSADIKSEFDYASKSYLEIIREIPRQAEDIFSKQTPEKIKYLNDVRDVRAKVLRIILDDKQN